MLMKLTGGLRLFVCLPLLIQLLVSPLLAGPIRSPVKPPTARQQNKIYKISPERGKPGTYDVLVSSSDSSCATGGELTDATLVAPQGGPIQVVETRIADKCNLTARIIVLQDALPSKVTLWIEKQNSILGTAEFAVTEPVTAGQIPTADPQVDIMWSVLPQKTVSHNFGRAIAKNYYAIEIVVGNNSAYNLQIVSVGFELPRETDIDRLLARQGTGPNGQQQQQQQQQQHQNKGQQQTSAELERELFARANSTKTIVPTSSYRITRGSLEANHMLHTRTLFLSTITALGPLLTGFIPFFHNVNRRANFSEGINILSNPLEKGLELVWPDPRPNQRERFDDQVLRDGLVIRNNTQTRTLAFFPKALLRLPESIESNDEYKKWKDLPMSVRWRLGKLVLVGDLIHHVNRISVTPNAPTELAAPPVITNILPNAPVKELDQGIKLEIHGSNLRGASFRVLGVPGIRIDTTDYDPNGRVVSAIMNLENTVPPGNYSIVVTTPAGRGSDSYPIEIAPIPFTDVTMTLSPQPAQGNSEKQTVQVEITGKYLHGATLQVVNGNSIRIDPDKITISKDGTRLTGVINVEPNTVKGSDSKLILKKSTQALNPTVETFDIFK